MVLQFSLLIGVLFFNPLLYSKNPKDSLRSGVVDV
jgi:hypothetical protein